MGLREILTGRSTVKRKRVFKVRVTIATSAGVKATRQLTLSGGTVLVLAGCCARALEVNWAANNSPQRTSKLWGVHNVASCRDLTERYLLSLPETAF